MSAFNLFFCTTILGSELSGFWKVRAVATTVTDVFVPLQVCHHAIYLYGIDQDDDVTAEVMNSLLYLDQPFEFHTLHYVKNLRSDDFISVARSTCLAQVVLVHDYPFMRQTSMSLILKRYNRARGNENDFVLVLAESKAGISKRSNWRMGALKYILPRSFPDNALLIELDDSIESENGPKRRHVLDIYIFQLYCDQDQEVCWKHRSVASFPKHKNDFDANFSRERAQWRYNYNRWPMDVHIYSLENIDCMARMTFRQATWGRFTEDDYISVENDICTYNAPTIWLAFEIADHMNATLQPRPRRRSFEQRTEIRPWEHLAAHRVLEAYPYTQNLYLKFGYYIFGYCTNGTEEPGTANIFAFFTPYDVMSWILLGLVMVATAVLGWLAGHGFQLFQLVASLASQSFSVNPNSRLAALFVIWHVVAFLMFNFYSAFLESVLAVPNPPPRIQDFKTLNASCHVPWIYTNAEADLKERFRDIPHMKALIDRSQVTSTFTLPAFFRKIVAHEKQCIIQQPAIDDSVWPKIGGKFQPGATCSEGKEKLIGDPVMWLIMPPNAAVVYRTVRTLEAGGILTKFRQYFQHRYKQRFDLFLEKGLLLQLSEQNGTDTNKEQSDIQDIDGFTMANLKTVFKSYLVLSSCALLVFFVEYLNGFVHISCNYDLQ